MAAQVNIARNPCSPRCMLVVLSVAAQLACVAGARYDVRADSARYPISFSPVLFGPDGELLALGHELVEVGSFRLEGRRFGLVYGLVKLGSVDISDAVNREVTSRNGDGVVSLSVTSSDCVTNWFVPLTLLPICPGCQASVVTGVVVRNAAVQRNPESIP